MTSLRVRKYTNKGNKINRFSSLIESGLMTVDFHNEPSLFTNFLIIVNSNLIGNILLAAISRNLRKPTWAGRYLMAIITDIANCLVEIMF